MVELERKIRLLMSDYRFNHTLAVVKECKALAELYDADKESLTISAYLHDITKEMPVNEQLDLCNSVGIKIDKHTLLSPKTLHSFSAPALILKKFPEYATEEVLNCIKYHTTGRAEMTLNEKLLFLADYIEPTRKYDDCILLRKTFYESPDDRHKKLDNTIFLALKFTIADLIENEAYIHPETINAYNHLKAKGGKI